jgi:hypothetical protein
VNHYRINAFVHVGADATLQLSRGSWYRMIFSSRVARWNDPQRPPPLLTVWQFKKIDLAITDVKTVILTLRATEIEVCSKALEALETFAFLCEYDVPMIAVPAFERHLVSPLS